MFGTMDAHTIIYGILALIVSMMGLGMVFTNKRADIAEEESREAKVDLKVEQIEVKNETEPIDKLVSDFDNELDDDSRKKPNS